MNKIKPRVRFAPSPTGQLHLGGARTALFNWLFARQNNGQFLLRIEDTDKIRSKQEFTDQICNSLHWLGLDWDEDIIYQSKRLKIYRSAIKKLVESGNAYRCFCSKEKIAKERAKAELAGTGYLYSGQCLSLTNEQIKQNINQGILFSIRIKVPEGYTEFTDNIYGKIIVNNKEIDDFIIARNDGRPVYNLVVAVDDFDMNISHVIRGEDHISNTAKQLTVNKLLEYPIPQFAHLPTILGSDKKRLSKRHGSTGIQEYYQSGYLPEAMNNYLALLGWNPGTEQEIFSASELIKQFSIKRVQKKSAIFDEQKLQWVNGQHLNTKSSVEIFNIIGDYTPNWIIGKDKEYLLKVINLLKGRFKTLNDVREMSKIFFNDPQKYNPMAVKKNWKNISVNKLLKKLVGKLKSVENWNANTIEKTYRKFARAENISVGKIIHPTRLALSGTSVGPSLFEMIELLGKETCLRRIETAIYKLPLKEKDK